MVRFRKTAAVLVIFMALPMAQAWAATSAASNSTEVSLRSDSFVSSDYQSPAGNSFEFLGAKYNNQENINVSGLFSPQQSVMSYLNITQLYVEVSGMQLGRKLMNWSLLDEQWHLGLFQPQFRWNPLTPESQGLTGLFLTLHNEDREHPMGARFFGSFLFLPDQGAGYQIQNGTFQAVNPWFQQLPSRVQFDNAGHIVNKLNWNIDMPDTSKVVLNPSLIAQFFYGHEQKETYFSATAGYQPSNQLLLAVNTGTLASAQTNINIHPELYYHTLGAMDLRYSLSNVYVGMSYIAEKPTAVEDMPANLNYRVYNSRQIYSPNIGIKAYGLDANLSFLDMQGQEDFATGPQSQDLGNYLPNRFATAHAWQAQISYLFRRQFLPGLKMTSNYIQGASDDFALWNTSAHYKLTKQWSLDGSLLLVRADSVSTTSSLFQQYQNNDLVSLGANYAF